MAAGWRECPASRAAGHPSRLHVQAAARHFPRQPGIDGAEGQFAAHGPRTGAGHGVEYPAQLGAGKIRIEHQACFRVDGAGQAARAQVLAQRFRAAVLPDDGVVDGFARGAVPHHRRFALVGDAQRAQRIGPQARLGQHFAAGLYLAVPDFHRVVLDPARLREQLAKFALRHGDDGACFIEDHAARTGGALVEGQQIRHAATSCARCTATHCCRRATSAGAQRKPSLLRRHRMSSLLLAHSTSIR